jgi:hypothetical protein
LEHAKPDSGTGVPAANGAPLSGQSGMARSNLELPAINFLKYLQAFADFMK